MVEMKRMRLLTASPLLTRGELKVEKTIEGVCAESPNL